MSQYLSSSSKPILRRGIYSSGDNYINEEINSYSEYEKSILDQIKLLAEKFPQKNIKELKQLIEQFDSIDLATKELENSVEKAEKQQYQEELPDRSFNYPNLPIELENKYLKEAIAALYRDYLKKIKQSEQLKLKLLLSEQKIKRMQCLHNSIKQRSELESQEEAVIGEQ